MPGHSPFLARSSPPNENDHGGSSSSKAAGLQPANRCAAPGVNSGRYVWSCARRTGRPCAIPQLVWLLLCSASREGCKGVQRQATWDSTLRYCRIVSIGPFRDLPAAASGRASTVTVPRASSSVAASGRHPHHGTEPIHQVLRSSGAGFELQALLKGHRDSIGTQ